MLLHISATTRLAQRVYNRAEGFTVIETLMILAVLGLLVVLLAGGIEHYAVRQSFTAFVTDVHDGIVTARTKTLAASNNTAYGVYVGTSTIEFFPGATPAVGSSTNTIIAIPTGMTATSSFSNHLPYLSFDRLTGAARATGTITLGDTVANATSTITITAAGLVQ